MKLPITIVLLAASQLVFADNSLLATCNSGATERLIEVVYPTGNKLPCEVRYTKAGASQVLWSARNQRGYCEQRAAVFVEKQKGWGWLCSDLKSLKASGNANTSTSQVRQLPTSGELAIPEAGSN
ncbi:hypothetical protein [Pelagibaculum spongiae]|uniref:hypothetical protein n=1 Tax=Pelagibaculum spongiae TaxID=2080658 RepID=UPI0015A7A8BA|nr:hypothetical protein [Pelagibaculum spongiae]